LIDLPLLYFQSQEAIQENNFWNATLRSYPGPAPDQQTHPRAKPNRVPQNTGLVVIDLSRNKLTNRGGIALAHLLSENKWILGLSPSSLPSLTGTGLNLSSNRIEEKGIDRLLRDILSPDRIECAMICLHICGNPGCDERILETLSQIAQNNLRHPIFSNESQFEIMTSIYNWLNDQKGEFESLLLSVSTVLSDMRLPRKKVKQSVGLNGVHNGRVEDEDDEMIVPDEQDLEDDDERDDDERDDEDDNRALNHSNNGSREYSRIIQSQDHDPYHDQQLPHHHEHHQQHDHQLEYVSGDVLSVQSDERIHSSHAAHPPRYPPQESLIESFDFDGFSPTQGVGYDDINGR
jgi:hypothetical protein